RPLRTISYGPIPPPHSIIALQTRPMSRAPLRIVEGCGSTGVAYRERNSPGQGVFAPLYPSCGDWRGGVVDHWRRAIPAVPEPSAAALLGPGLLLLGEHNLFWLAFGTEPRQTQ